MKRIAGSLLCICAWFMRTAAQAEEQVFSGVVDQVIDASLFGSDIEAGDPMNAITLALSG